MLALIAALTAGCDRPAAKSSPHVVLVTADALRADHLSGNGYPRATSPRLDAFARTAWSFSNAVTVLPKTGPSFVTLFSGLHPRVHLVEANRYRIPSDVPLLAERLKTAGYRTAAFVSNPVLSSGKGYARGFESYRIVDGVAAVNGAFREWAEAAWQSPTFVWVHYIDPHGPYTPPADLADLFADDALARAETRRLPLDYAAIPGFPLEYALGAIPRYQRIDGEDRVADYVLRYDREIRHVDRAFGEILDLLAARGLFDASAVIFTSDHGESLGERDYFFEHGWFVDEGSLRIPLFVKPPGTTAAVSISAPVSNLDLAPTILALAGVEPVGTPGRNLLAPLPDRRPMLIANTSTYPERYFGLRVDGRKYFRRVATAREEGQLRDDPGPEELYDLTADAGETMNLAAVRPEQIAAMRAEMASLLAESRPPAGREPISARDGNQDVERLRALGYVD